MKVSSDFLKISSADFIVRAAYQMGKTPLLPLFAATLGADGAFLGFIVSVSTLTGLVTKPLFGIFSDRWGRRLWLLIGTAFFVGMPFLYMFVQSPEQLLLLRLLHGTATAIYGPVTLAYIAELLPDNVAEGLGWFGIARSGGYIVGPAVAGWLLLSFEAAQVFTIIGIISALAILPVILLKDVKVKVAPKAKQALGSQIVEAIQQSMRTPSIWLSGVLEAITFVALYTVKAFLPVFALNAGVNVALVGLFFSVQEAVHVLVKPFGGRLGDKIGHVSNIIVGIVILSVGLLLLPIFTGLALFIPAILTGLAQAFIFPSTVALVSEQMPKQNLGAGMGFIGMWQNFGKVVGPVMGGFAITQIGFEATLILIVVMLLIGALIIPILFAKLSHQDEEIQARYSY